LRCSRPCQTRPHRRQPTQVIDVAPRVTSRSRPRHVDDLVIKLNDAGGSFQPPFVDDRLAGSSVPALALERAYPAKTGRLHRPIPTLPGPSPFATGGQGRMLSWVVGGRQLRPARFLPFPCQLQHRSTACWAAVDVTVSKPPRSTEPVNRFRLRDGRRTPTVVTYTSNNLSLVQQPLRKSAIRSTISIRPNGITRVAFGTDASPSGSARRFPIRNRGGFSVLGSFQKSGPASRNHASMIPQIDVQRGQLVGILNAIDTPDDVQNYLSSLDR